MVTRYSKEDAFARRTIYCNDLKKLYAHIDDRLRRSGLV